MTSIEKLLKELDDFKMIIPDGGLKGCMVYHECVGFLFLKAIKEQKKEEQNRILKILDEWDYFTCHSREEHSTNDCPGWSHEDNDIRKTLIKQIRHQIIL